VRILSIDQGTSGTKAIVVDADGTVRALAEVPVHPTYPSPGAVEQDPGELLDSVLDAGRRALAEAGGTVDAVALANQGETVLTWDPTTGAPLSSALVWQDSRSQSVCDGLVDHRELIAQRTGLVLDPYFSAPKMAWLRDNGFTDGVVTTTDSWLVHHLTGEFVTDASTASRSLVLDIDAVEWDAELLSLFGLADEALPRVVSNDEVVGVTTAFGAELPMAGLVVDQQAALLAERCFDVGSAKCTFGTGAFLLANTGSRAPRSQHGLTTSVAWSTGEGTQYCLDGQVYTAASAVRWMADIGLIEDTRRLDAASDADSGGTYFVPALAGLAAPWWRSDARACFAGMSLATTRGHLVRAVVEGVAATVARLVQVVAAEAGTPIASLRVDGGLTHSRTLMQVQADLLQAPVEVYPSAHATPLGAAALARMAVGGVELDAAVWPWSPSQVFEPRWSADRAAEFLAEWQRVVDSTLARSDS
jgi:glycerol kinase